MPVSDDVHATGSVVLVVEVLAELVGGNVLSRIVGRLGLDEVDVEAEVDVGAIVVVAVDVAGRVGDAVAGTGTIEVVVVVSTGSALDAPVEQPAVTSAAEIVTMPTAR